MTKAGTGNLGLRVFRQVLACASLLGGMAWQWNVRLPFIPSREVQRAFGRMSQLSEEALTISEFEYHYHPPSLPAPEPGPDLAPVLAQFLLAPAILTRGDAEYELHDFALADDYRRELAKLPGEKIVSSTEAGLIIVRE